MVNVSNYPTWILWDIGVSQNEGRKSHHSRWKLAVLVPKSWKLEILASKSGPPNAFLKDQKIHGLEGPKKKHPPHEKGDETAKKQLILSMKYFDFFRDIRNPYNGLLYNPHITE